MCYMEPGSLCFHVIFGVSIRSSRNLRIAGDRESAAVALSPKSGRSMQLRYLPPAELAQEPKGVANPSENPAGASDPGERSTLARDGQLPLVGTPADGARDQSSNRRDRPDDKGGPHHG